MGRPLGAFKGRTEQADEFARWLRKVTEGVTVRTLEQHFPYGKSSWSGFRDGSRLPTRQLVERVIGRYVREPALRARQLDHGLRLLQVAQQAAKDLENDSGRSVALPGPRSQAGDPTASAWLRLDDARQRQIEAMQQLAASERRREKLEDMVSVLEERCILLESERDRAREDAHAELQHELHMSTEYRRQADEKLEHARRAEERAYQLRLAAERQVTIERMALRRLDQDATPGHPPLSAQSLVQELNLPPLDQIHELLNVVQEQLDAQDDELNDLGEQIDLGARHDADDTSRLPPRVVQGRLVEDAPAATEHRVFGLGQDNPRKLLTSENGAPNRTDKSNQGETEGNLGVDQSTELVIGLEKANTPAALSTALSQLRRRTGRRPISDLTQAAFPGRLTDDLVLMTVMRWIDGDVLPDTWLHLKSLVKAMGATDPEVDAFQQAYTRTIDAHLPGPVSPYDLSDLAATRRLAGVRGPLALPWNWTMAILSPCLIVLITTAYTAALRSEPRPGLWKLAGYGAPSVLICLLLLLAAMKESKPFVAAGGRRAQSRSARAGLGMTLIAFPVGLAAPWVLNSVETGRWLATLVGLLP
ncbi:MULTISPECIES: tropomyosin [Streptomyces]|uniref:hypothetical protein n=1 Tax=Streptomyces TaxID=1883 RepID=UPI0004CAD64E|nr:hypothetical protein [Streptomyces flavovirens]